jgi:hypothetical protein
MRVECQFDLIYYLCIDYIIMFIKTLKGLFEPLVIEFQRRQSVGVGSV